MGASHLQHPGPSDSDVRDVRGGGAGFHEPQFLLLLGNHVSEQENPLQRTKGRPETGSNRGLPSAHCTHLTERKSREVHPDGALPRGPPGSSAPGEQKTLPKHDQEPEGQLDSWRGIKAPGRVPRLQLGSSGKEASGSHPPAQSIIHPDHLAARQVTEVASHSHACCKGNQYYKFKKWKHFKGDSFPCQNSLKTTLQNKGSQPVICFLCAPNPSWPHR